MPRAPNFTYRNPLEEVTPSLVRAIFGDPEMAAKQQQLQAEMQLRTAQADEARAKGGLYTSQTTGQNQQNTAAAGLPGLFANMYADPPALPTLDDPDFVTAAGPSGPAPTRDSIFRAGLPALLGNMGIMQGDKIDPRQMVGTAASFGGGDEMARRGLIAQGHSPTADFAITPGRADEIAARDAGEDRTTKFGVAGIQRKSAFDVATLNNRDDVPVANIRAGATRDVAAMKGTGPAPGFDVIQRSFPGVKMNSGWRSVEHNKRVDGVPNSLHLGNVPGVMGYDFDAIPGMTVEQVAAKIERDSGGTIVVVEAVDERGRKGPNGKALGGYHLGLKNVGGPAPKAATAAKPGAAPKPGKSPSKVVMTQIENGVNDYFTRYGVTPSPAARAAIIGRAVTNWQTTGNPVTAVSSSVQYFSGAEKARRAKAAKSSGRPTPGAPTARDPKTGKQIWYNGSAWVPVPGAGGASFTTDAEADAYASDPRNKGKTFVGPDGKTYRVK